MNCWSLYACEVVRGVARNVRSTLGDSEAMSGLWMQIDAADAECRMQNAGCR